MTTPNGRDDRDRKLAQTLVDLADTLVHDFDVVVFLQHLSDSCVDLFDLSSAGVMLQDRQSALQVIASSDERGRTLELMELQNQEGPCLDAFRLKQPVQASGPAADDRWPIFAAHARTLGYQSFAALPMRLRDQTIGALNMFGAHDHVLEAHDLKNAQALADIATIGLLNERAVREARLVAEQLQHALTSRVVLEQAKGIIAVRLDCHVDQSFEVMRSYARSHNLRLSDIAREVVEGSFDVTLLKPRNPRER
jgi:transcriptional regulator with GAF, ATPase, and Fis domain